MQISKKEVLNLLNQFNSNILDDPIILHYKNFQDKTYTKKMYQFTNWTVYHARNSLYTEHVCDFMPSLLWKTEILKPK